MNLALQIQKAMQEKTKITIQALVAAPIELVWNCWVQPEHIVQWNQASDDWHCPAAVNDLRVGGKYSSTMAAKDGSFSFDFGGTYDRVELHSLIVSTLEDDRKVETTFAATSEGTLVTTVFEAESENSVELQQGGWQAILNSFKHHAESVRGHA